MNYCTGDCNQGRTQCNCKGIQMDAGKQDRYLFLEEERNYHKMNKYLRWVLFFGALYFLGHIGYALAQTNPNPPIIRCIPAGNGTVTCFPI